MEVRRAVRAVLRAGTRLPARMLSIAAAGQREAEVLRVLRDRVKEPVSDRDIVSVGALQVRTRDIHALYIAFVPGPLTAPAHTARASEP